MSDIQFSGKKVDAPSMLVEGSSRLPDYVKCSVCGKPPQGADWLKPMDPSPNCRKFIHLSHIENGPGVSSEAGHILRNS